MAIRSLNVSVLGVFCAKTKDFEDADCHNQCAHWFRNDTLDRGCVRKLNFHLSQQLAERRRGMACLARLAQARPCPCSAQFIALGRSQSLLLEEKVAARRADG